MPLAQIIAAQAMRALLAQQRVTARTTLPTWSTSGYQKGRGGLSQLRRCPGRRPSQARASTGAVHVAAATGAPQPTVGLDLATAGRLEQTGNPLDLALEGRGWMVTGSAAAPSPGAEWLLHGGQPRGLLVSVARASPSSGEDGQPIQVQGRDVRVACGRDGEHRRPGGRDGSCASTWMPGPWRRRDACLLCVPAGTIPPCRHAQVLRCARDGWRAPTWRRWARWWT